MLEAKQYSMYIWWWTSTYGRTWWSVWGYTSSVGLCDPCPAWSPLHRPPPPTADGTHCRLSSARGWWALCWSCQRLRGRKEEENRAFVGHVLCFVCVTSDIVTEMKHDKNGCLWSFDLYSCIIYELYTVCIFDIFLIMFRHKAATYIIHTVHEFHFYPLCSWNSGNVSFYMSPSHSLIFLCCILLLLFFCRNDSVFPRDWYSFILFYVIDGWMDMLTWQPSHHPGIDCKETK